MEQLSNELKKRIVDFIDYNELDYIVVDNPINKFHIVSESSLIFYFYKMNEQYVIAEYNAEKQRSGFDPYIYYEYQNMQQIMEQISHYDNSLHKTWWQPTIDSIDLCVESNGYNDLWYENFITSDKWKIIEENNYKVLSYQEDRKCKLHSQFNTLHLHSTINEYKAVELDQLYFEVYPLSCESKREVYLVKVLYNNEEVLKEYLNFKVWKKRGLKLFLESLFKEVKGNS